MFAKPWPLDDLRDVTVLPNIHAGTSILPARGLGRAAGPQLQQQSNQGYQRAAQKKHVRSTARLSPEALTLGIALCAGGG